MTIHSVPGVRRSTLRAQLAGLGLVRVLAEQADPNLRCWFEGSTLMIDSSVDDLAVWLVDEYQPMPVLSPWNKASGFGPGVKTPERSLAQLLALDSPRLQPLRDAHRVVAGVALEARTQQRSKAEIVARVRSVCPEGMLPWLDVAIIALDADQLAFPPILVAGGNDGRLEFSSNFHQRLLDVIPTSPRRRMDSLGLVSDVLHGTSEQPLARAAVGTFDPGGTGTPNSSPFGAAESLVNPWSFVLMIEGVVLFAAAPARRLDSQARGVAQAAMTFMTMPSEIGTMIGSASENARGEVWVPWWTSALSPASVRQIFHEGRAVWRGRTAVGSGDMYLAAASHGTSAAVTGFDRYVIAQRNGTSHSATLIEEVEVRADPATLVVADVEDWPNQVGRRTALPRTVSGPAQVFASSRVALARARTGYGQIRETCMLLRAITGTELAVGRSTRARDEVEPVARPRSVHRLGALISQPTWQPLRDTPEFQIAAGLASLVFPPRSRDDAQRTLREVLLPIEPAARPGSRPTWQERPLVQGLGQRRLVEVMGEVAEVMLRSSASRLSASAPGERSEATEFTNGVIGPNAGLRTSVASLHAWVLGRLDDDLIEEWLYALLPFDWSTYRQLPRPAVQVPMLVHPTLAVLGQLRTGLRRREDPDRQRLGLRPEWLRWLRAGRVAQAHGAAAESLRIAGFAAAPAPRQVVGDLGPRVLAALLPVADHGLVRRSVARPLRPAPDQPSFEPEAIDPLEETA